MAEKKEKECGNWQELPETEMTVKLRERIMAEVEKRDKESYQNRDIFTDKIMERMR